MRLIRISRGWFKHRSAAGRIFLRKNINAKIHLYFIIFDFPAKFNIKNTSTDVIFINSKNSVIDI